jgi:hypothetical protein
MISRSSVGRPRRLPLGGAGASFLGAEFFIFVRLINDSGEVIVLRAFGTWWDFGWWCWEEVCPYSRRERRRVQKKRNAAAEHSRK